MPVREPPNMAHKIPTGTLKHAAEVNINHLRPRFLNKFPVPFFQAADLAFLTVPASAVTEIVEPTSYRPL